VIAGVSIWCFYFRLYNGTTCSLRIVELLKALQATSSCPLTNPNSIRSLAMYLGVECDHDRVIEYLPSRARPLAACLDTEPQLVFEVFEVSTFGI
jgi:hypothetical protein